MISFHENIVFLLAKAHQKAQGVLKGHLLDFGLTPMQCLFMESLWEEDGLSVGEIGRRIALDTATLAGVLERLVTAGWVMRETDRDDGRVTRVALTEKARSAIPGLTEIIVKTNSELLSNFPREKKILLKRFLRDMRG